MSDHFSRVPSKHKRFDALSLMEQDVDELLSKKKRMAAAANAIDSLLKATLEKASVAMQRWTLLQPGSLVLF